MIFVCTKLIAISDNENPIEHDPYQPTACQEATPSRNILSTQVHEANLGCVSGIFKRFGVSVSKKLDNIYQEVRSAFSRSEFSSPDSKDRYYTKENLPFNMNEKESKEAKQFLDQCGTGIFYVL